MICRHSFLQRTRWTTPTAGCSRRIFRRRQAARLQSTGRGPIWIPVFLHPLPWYLRRRSTPVPVQRGLIACYFKRVAVNGFLQIFGRQKHFGKLIREKSGKNSFCLYRGCPVFVFPETQQVVPWKIRAGNSVAALFLALQKARMA